MQQGSQQGAEGRGERKEWGRGRGGEGRAKSGYPCGMLLTPPPDDLKCSLCHEVLRDPVQVCFDQHAFCRSCIALYKTGSRSSLSSKNLPFSDISGTCHTRCPKCQSYMSREDSAKRETNEILQLEVRCLHGCGSNGGGGGGGGKTNSGAADKAGRQKKRKQDHGVPSPTSCGWTGLFREYAHEAACPFRSPAPSQRRGVASGLREGAWAHTAATHLLMMTRVAVVEAGCRVRAESAAEIVAGQAKITAVEAESAAVEAENAAMQGTIASLQVDSRRLQLFVSILRLWMRRRAAWSGCPSAVSPLMGHSYTPGRCGEGCVTGSAGGPGPNGRPTTGRGRKGRSTGTVLSSGGVGIATKGSL
ncbi:hypothetical protein B484DRAFT_451636 [Ochromonadaceae sp. CCMP2298]|nr:hypothetical protein B484DRAFT_451636 [Ochromonadaceae sp. CCMP2298]